MTATRREQALGRWLNAMEVAALTADGLSAGIVGVTLHSPAEEPRVVYDLGLVLEALRGQGMDASEAQEWFDYNVIGSWVGKQTPLFMQSIASIEEEWDE